VADAVGDFLAEGLRPLRRGEEFVDRFHAAVRTNIVVS
jgi:hypothetical protein